MRALLDDPAWGPRKLAHLIKIHNGLPIERTADLASYAPVELVDMSAEITCWPQLLTIDIDKPRCTLHEHEKFIISYETTPGRAHMECVTVEEFIGRRIKRLVAMIIKKDQCF